MYYYNKNKYEIDSNENEAVIYISATGLTKEDVSVNIENSVLSIVGEPSNRGLPIDLKFELDGSLCQEQIECSLENGELIIKIPKNKPKTKKIKIK